MRSSKVVSSVVGLHIVFALMIIFQGCATPVGSVAPPPEPIMPELVTMSVIEPVQRPVVRPVTTAWPSESVTYEVKSGDSLSTIAKKHGVRLSELIRINGITNPNKIRAKDTILIPVADSHASTVTPVHHSTPAPSKKLAGNVYVIQKGDCLGVIAHKCGVTIDELRQANGMTGDKIMAGQKLVIPSSGTVGVVAKRQPAKETPPAVKKETVKPAKVKKEVRRAPASTFGTHIVEKNDTWSKVARAWGLSESELRAANPTLGKKLKVGNEIQIPLD